MIIELGHMALILAFCVALVQATIPMLGAARGHAGWMAVGRNTALTQFVLVALAMAALMHAYVTSDFSVINVVRNSHTDKPLLYKVTGVWGNHEGSMLLWIFMLSLCGAALALFSGNLPPDLRARVLAVQGMISAGFLVFILLTSNPFLRMWPPAANGQGLNPVLQDPGLAFHPPFLYLGYVGFSVAFSFAVAALIEGRVDAAWARWVRPWSLASWCFLTVGIAMGSWWSYYTLGWGGWWFGDPVENACFHAMADRHRADPLRHRGGAARYAQKLDHPAGDRHVLVVVGGDVPGPIRCAQFGACVRRRSIAWQFYPDPVGRRDRRLADVVDTIRAPALKGGGLFAPVSREGALLLNNLLLATCAATVFLGTLYPLFLDAVGGPKVSVGPPFFDRTFAPLMVPVLIAMAVGPMLSWKRGDLLGALQRLWIAFTVTALFTLTALYVTYGGPVLAVFGLGIAVWTGMGVATEFAERVRLFRIPLGESVRRAINSPRSAIGMSLAHLGMAISVVGISASAFEREHLAIVPIGGDFTLAGYAFHFDKVENLQGPNYVASDATIEVRRNGTLIDVMHPERRYFALQGQTTAVTAIRTSPVADLYVALGDPSDNGWTIRAYWKPLISWIWGGAMVMALGGVVSLSDRRWRVGAATRSRQTVRQQTAAAE